MDTHYLGREEKSAQPSGSRTLRAPLMERLLDISKTCKGTFTFMRNRVRELRGNAGMTQSDLGAALGVSRQTINSIEAGRYLPSLPLALGMARLFGAGVEEIFEMEREDS